MVCFHIDPGLRLCKHYFLLLIGKFFVFFISKVGKFLLQRKERKREKCFFDLKSLSLHFKAIFGHIDCIKDQYARNW